MTNLLNFKKTNLFILFLILSTGAWSQIKIGDNPTLINADAVLEMESTNKGMLLPRLALTNTTSASPLTAHIAGMVVYNTAPAGDVTPGYYYNDGAKWVRVVGLADGKNLSAGSLLQLTGTPIGASLKDAGYKVDTTALKAFISSSIKQDSISGKNTSAGSLVIVTGGTGASLKDMTIAVNTVAMKDSFSKWIGQSPIKDSMLKVIAINISNSPLKDSLIAFLNNNLSADNGITKTGLNFQLGGALVKPTSISTDATNTLKITGLGTGASRDSVLVLDSATGVMKKISSAALLAGSTTNILTNPTNTITSTVNGVVASAPAVNTVSNTFNNNTRNLSTTVNGVAGSSVNIPHGPDSTTASNGLTLSGKDVKLGGALTAATTVTTSSTNTLAIAGLTSGSVSDSVMVVDPTTGVMKRVSASTLLKGATTDTLRSNGNMMTSKVNGVSDSAKIINSNTITKTGLKVVSSVNGVKDSFTLPSDSTLANNGLSKSGDTVQFGGNLNKATTLGTSATNTLKITGLGTGASRDSVLVLDSATGVMKKISTSSILAGATTDTLNSAGNIMTSKVNGISDTAKIINSMTTVKTGLKVVTTVNGVADSFTLPSDSTKANNGITKSGDTVQLGGALVKATSIGTDATNTLKITGLGTGASRDSVLVLDSATGVMKKISTSSLLAGATTHTLNSTGNIMTSVVNGISANDTIINSNTITLSGDTLTTTVNGVVSNKVGINSVEPWRSTVTNTGAKNNTDSVYIMGKVGVNTTTPNSYLSVNGSVATAARKVAAATTVTIDDFTVLANCTAGGYTVTLPAASSCNGRIYKVGKSDVTGNILTFSQSLFLSELVSFTQLNYNRMFTIQSIGGQWWVINQQ
jgi:trimeric autotransporter adhesin